MCQVTEDQMEALRRKVSSSPDASDTTKRVLLWMLDQTERLSVPVVLPFPLEHEALGQIAVDHVHWMVSHTRTTRIQKFLSEKLGLDYPRYRLYSRSSGNKAPNWQGWIYIGEGNRKSLNFNLEEIEQVRLVGK